MTGLILVVKKENVHHYLKEAGWLAGTGSEPIFPQFQELDVGTEPTRGLEPGCTRTLWKETATTGS